MPRSKKGLGRWHKSGTGNNQGRRRTTPRNNRGSNRTDCNSKSTETSLPAISVSLPLNNSFINTPQMLSVFQYSKSNELSSPVIHSHVPRRVLGGGTKVEPGTIRVVGERLLAINGALIAITVTQRAPRRHYRAYLFLFH